MKILLIEDDHQIAAYIKKGLELKSYVVDVVYDGEQGLDFALAEKYDLIILDRMLPKMDGLQLCQNLRQENNHTPVLMLTARAEVSDKVEGLNVGADDYLTKPFAFIELLARIKALTRRPKNLNTDKLTIDSLTLDTQSFQATRAGEIIKLSSKEFALLDFLMRHKGQPMSAAQLTERVWEYDSDVLPNTAQVYISHLRKKIDSAFPNEKPLIETVRGFGYKINDKP
ncbi:MAG: response regulator transcription factor [Patescibacteria group bacterium]|nr:response regulator transcription factor [Patescibacteria group bacterium]